jgi:FKBP-type peptidyl-prolyl cis-trans isomerase
MEADEPVESNHQQDEMPDVKLEPYIPGPAAVDISPKQDGGILKEIRRPGTGDEHPMTGDKVFVHYVGTLTDGTKFDSSRDRGQKFDFELGTGKVIKAWDIGVATMKRGELCVLLCKPEYAYGKTGSPPKIGPDATLVFEVELFDWKGEDVSEKKDEGIIRRIIKNGEGYMNPKDGATCEVHITGRCAERVFDDRDVTFIVGEGSEVGIIDGIEQAIKKFKKGEKSLLKIKSKYAYGTDGNTAFDIPPNTDVEYEVELKKFEKAKESWEMDTAEKLEQSEISKNKGTDYFKAGKYAIAKKYYTRIVDYLKSEDALKDDEAENRRNLLLAAHLNLAMCHLKQSEDIEACHACEEALKLDPKNEKGLFRRGTANLNLQNFDEAIKDFNAVLEVDPNNKAAKNQLVITTHKIKQIREREKHIFAGMFQKFAEIDAKKEKLNPAPPAEPKPSSDTTKEAISSESHSEAESESVETDSSPAEQQQDAEPVTTASA